MNEKIVGYVSSSKDIKNFLPIGTPDKFEMLGVGNDRKITYDENIYTILKSNKKIGVDIGDICPICNLGEVFDFGGCHSCKVCSAQLKCGL